MPQIKLSVPNMVPVPSRITQIVSILRGELSNDDKAFGLLFFVDRKQQASGLIVPEQMSRENRIQMLKDCIETVSETLAYYEGVQ